MESNLPTIEFKEYPEIENHYHKVTQKILEEYKGEEPWVAMEKVHGTNFCFLFDGQEEVRCCRRNNFLQLSESFYNFQSVFEAYQGKVRQIFEEVRAEVQDLHYVKVFGELYGGTYPGVKSTQKAVQTTIVYCPKVDFIAFDLFYKTKEGQREEILNYKKACALFEKVQLPFAEILHEGTVRQLLEQLDAEKFESEIYLKHGLPKVEGNMAEGYVIKPVEAVYLDDGARFVIKVKNSKHLESAPAQKAPKQAPPKKEAAPLTEEEEKVVAQALSYISEARFHNIISKLPEDQRVEKTVSGLMMQDAWKDFAKAEEKATVDKANKLKGRIMPQMKELAAKLFADIVGASQQQ